MRIILLSGGSGKRLWPLSSLSQYEQFLKLLPSPEPGGEPISMVQRVWRQLGAEGLRQSAVISTGRGSAEILASQLGEDVPLIVEPESRDTFPAIALASSWLSDEADASPDETVVVFPVDCFADSGFFTLARDLPKTKPKACNYGLIRAKGEFVVIYDAEDQPDPDQLKKVHLTFKSLPDDYVCVQAKLNYFDSTQNLLTRWFTHEYSMWFELLLPGIMRLDVPIPLGGTSNHFKTSVLRAVDAWDPYNVTEDADLGIRLYKHGYKTAIVDSRTWEEANSRVGNWIRQRSRWIKGYMQTWLVHMRHPVRFYRELGWRGFWGFQVMVLATPMLPLLNPFYWVLLALWYGWHMDFIPPLFPGIIYYFAAFEFLLGNFLFVYSHVAGMYWVIRDLEAKRDPKFSYGMVKYGLLVPIYWVLMSNAAMKAAWQLMTRPFYWEKTIHGLDAQEGAEADSLGNHAA